MYGYISEVRREKNNEKILEKNEHVFFTVYKKV